MQLRPSRCEPLESRTLFAAGDPLDEFGVGGYAPMPRGSESARPTSISEAPGGKLLISVVQQPNGSKTINDVYNLLRYNPDGTLDSTFGGDGTVRTFFDSVEGVTQAAGGRFYIVGTVNDPEGLVRPTWWLARYHSDGGLDRRFGGGDGKVLVQTNVIRKELRAEFLHLTREGVLTLKGVAPSLGTQGPLAIARFGPDGRPDAAFGSGGVTELGDNRTKRVRLFGPVAGDGSVYFLKSPQNVLQKLTPRGLLDRTFGAGGEVIARNSPEGIATVSVVGADLFIGIAMSFSRYQLVKLDARGRTDRAFGTSGSVTLPEGVFPGDVLRQDNGKLLIPGYTNSRVNADGTLDATFARTGLSTRASTIGRNGVLYSTHENEVHATSLDDRGTPLARRGLDGVVTLVGTPRNDRLRIEAIGSGNADDIIQMSRNNRWQYFNRAEVTTGVVVEGGSGADGLSASRLDAVTLIGGPGNDGMFLSATSSRAHASGGTGNDTIGASGTRFTVEAGSGDDTIYAEFPFEVPASNDPPASLYGGHGNDVFIVEAIPDHRGIKGYALFGDAGNDYLRSSYSNDTLTGGPGRDTLRSGGGVDLFVGDDDDAD
ncbi:MAG TPA: hypothetical protein VGB55_05480 [Tepidisphaeraceae bacterium]|jgi:uncharacterized delta-60 repeat protein